MVWVLLDKTLPGSSSSSLIEMVWSSGPFLSCLRLQKKKVRRTFYIFSQLCLQVVSLSFSVSSFLHETLSKGMQQFVFQLQFLNGMGNIWAAKKFESNSGKVSRIPFTVFYSYYNISFVYSLCDVINPFPSRRITYDETLKDKATCLSFKELYCFQIKIQTFLLVHKSKLEESTNTDVN